MNKVTDNKYVFSCYVKRNMPALKRRPWWNLLGKDKLIFVKRWERFVLTDLNERQSQALQKADFLNDVWPSLLLRAINEIDIHSIQLERQH